MGHIKELENDRIDTQTFFFHGTKTGDNITEVAGHRFWQIIEDLSDDYACSHCKEGAQALAHGGHDTISLLVKGRYPETPEHFEKLHELVNLAWDKYVEMCKGGDCPTVEHR